MHSGFPSLHFALRLRQTSQAYRPCLATTNVPDVSSYLCRSITSSLLSCVYGIRWRSVIGILSRMHGGLAIWNELPGRMPLVGVAESGHERARPSAAWEGEGGDTTRLKRCSRIQIVCWEGSHRPRVLTPGSGWRVGLMLLGRAQVVGR